MKRYIVTSYIPNSEINIDCFNTLKNMAKRLDAKIIVPLTSPNTKKEDGCVHELIEEFATIDEIYLNKSLLITDIPSNINIIDPLSGMESIATSKGSLIVPTTRHRFKSVARSLKHGEYPRGIWGTGTISTPYYKENKTGYKVKDYHLLGALLVEINNQDIFHIRQLTYKNGFIYDLNKRYCSNGTVKTVPVEAISLGDLHPPFTHPLVLEATKNFIKKYSPNNVIYHDVFDACSISHHTEGKYLTQALVNQIYPNLNEELRRTADCLKSLVESGGKKHIIVKSNHDEHLDKYLDEFRFRDDEHNLILALELALEHVKFKRKVSSQGALEYALKDRGLPSKVKFLERGDRLDIKGIEVSNHGDFGANGSRGSSKEHGLAFTGKIITGHAHTPEIGPYGNYVNGTMTYLSLPYTNDSGTSGWLNTHTLIYKNGTMSHYHIIV